MKQKATFTFDIETLRRLDQIVKLRHCSKSQAITDWIWMTKLPSEDEKIKMVFHTAQDHKAGG